MTRGGFLYILASERNGTLYIGVTSDLVRRVWQHRTAETKGFTTRYGIERLVYFEAFDDIETAIAREKAMKKYRRKWKLELIEKTNPEWRDLYPEITGSAE